VGCSGVELADTSAAGTGFDFNLNSGGAAASTTGTAGSPGLPLGTVPTANTPNSGYLGNVFQAVLKDGSSMISGVVGDINGPTQGSGNTTCIDVGGVAGH
jgi:hypothetical protein